MLQAPPPGNRRQKSVVAMVSVMLASCTQAPLPESQSASQQVDRFTRWHDAGHRKEVGAYLDFLRQQDLSDAVPIHALLRTSRRWQLCLHDEFSVPPPALWKNMTSTLRVIAQLHEAGIIDPALARSVYRNERVNRCAGGASQSRHLTNAAIDFDLPDKPDNVEKLCGWWRKYGHASKVGLGFYSTTTIHIDTTGFRTWGSDRHRATSLCIKRK